MPKTSTSAWGVRADCNSVSTRETWGLPPPPRATGGGAAASSGGGAGAAAARTFTESYAYGAHPLGELRYRDANVSRRDAEPGKSPGAGTPTTGQFCAAGNPAAAMNPLSYAP